jgi:signal transduction histidine kinase/response regulator RpfG family c-di-GMP phosphodiesterase/HAMP domain-containing protein
MKLNNLNIGTQLRAGFAVMLFFVIIMGAVSYYKGGQIHRQMDEMYDHPLIVRRAINMLTTNLLVIQRNIKDLIFNTDENEIEDAINQIEIMKVSALEQMGILRSKYLGPVADIESLELAFITWHSIHDETIRLLREGKIQEAAERTKNSGIGGKQALVVMSALKRIDDFAKNKTDSFYIASIEMNDSLNRQLILLVVAIIILSVVLIFILLRNIRKPLDEITMATRRFHDGDLNARSSYASQNEFGVLSKSFNTLAESIQVKKDIDEKFASLAGLMLSEYDVKKFFQTTLNALALHTGSQMAAIYLLSDDEKTFDHFESLGVDDNARQSFAADRFEGEFGSVLASRKVQHIKNIPDDTRFVFHTVSGRFIPHEIITLPILADNKVVAVISLASVTAFTRQSVQLIDNILVTLSARVEGILAYHRIKEFLDILENQNRELETQKNEMALQAAELTEQNTELEMQKEQLDEAGRLKTNFLSNMSHELRTPLNSVIALSGVLSRRLANQIPAEEYSYLEVIERNGKHLLEIINDILDISRIEAGREEIEITKFNANSLIAGLVSMIMPQATEKNIALLHKESDAGLFLTSDAGKCSHILQNLIGNAVKFTEKGQVEVIGRQKDNRIEITVTDTGIGISENHLPHIFDEFRQADGTTSRRFGGTGLGLAIANKYANLLGGTVSVKSAPGKGSEFTLTLPLIHSEGNKITDPGGSSPGFSHSVGQSAQMQVSGLPAKTILLVDDSEPSIIQMKDILEERGYHLLVARDGGEALAIIAQTIPDAMILDLMMPGIDGFKVLKILREAEPTANIPVLILTAKQITKEELSFLTRNNIHQLIQKGDVNRRELLNAVASMVCAATEESASPPAPAPVREGKPVVLVVEDNPDNMITVKALLSGIFTVLEAVNGNKGVEMARKHKPDLVLMDIALPEMDGIEAFQAIRKDSRLQHIPVIALTASAMTSDRETILAFGFDAYIAKPIDEIVFFNTINETLYGK